MLGLRTYLWPLVLLLAAPPSHAASGTGTEDVDYRTLTLDDYPIRPIPSPWDAYTWTYMSYHYNQTTSWQGDAYRADLAGIDIKCTLIVAKSWRHQVMQDPQATLKHEQGHFDICEGKAHFLRSQSASAFPSGRGNDEVAAKQDLQRSLNAYFAQHLADVEAQHARYDKETRHGRRLAQQSVWSKKLAQALRAAYPPAQGR